MYRRGTQIRKYWSKRTKPAETPKAVKPVEWIRIMKPLARKYWDAGMNLTIIPCKANPYSMWYQAHTVKHQGLGTSFQNFLDQFEHYNCSSETGYYAAFYVTPEIQEEYNKLTQKVEV